jgi:hypothetical protein
MMKTLKAMYAKATLNAAIIKDYTKLLGKEHKSFVKKIVTGRCSEAEFNQFKNMVKTAAK